jgi:hypothetical protein
MTNVEKMFEMAVRSKMRFSFKGVLSVEDLWDLNVQNLDTIYKSLNAQVKQAQEESLLTEKTKEDKELEVKIEIVKYIVSVKKAEAQAKLEEKQKREKKQQILELLAMKENQELQNKSPEELKAMLQELEV